MEQKELYEKMQILLEILEQYKKNQTLDFGTLERKQYLIDVLRVMYNRPSLQPDLNCSTCVLAYLNQLVPYYERTYPEYLKSIETVEEKPLITKPKRQAKKNGKKA